MSLRESALLHDRNKVKKKDETTIVQINNTYCKEIYIMFDSFRVYAKENKIFEFGCLLQSCW